MPLKVQFVSLKSWNECKGWMKGVITEPLGSIKLLWCIMGSKKKEEKKRTSSKDPINVHFCYETQTTRH